MTFSVVACDPDTGACGVAVASRFLAVGSVVPFVRAGVGAVATQALANVRYGPDGLALLDREPAATVVERLTRADQHAAHRQVGIVDRHGQAATFTGERCMPWAGGAVGDGAAIQGNILAGPGVVDAMRDVWATTGGSLADRLLAALSAGDAAGGDRRGRQSAALLVHRPEGGYLGDDERYLDLRVDDHPDPVVELGRLRRLHALLWDRPDEGDLLAITEPVAAELRRLLTMVTPGPAAALGSGVAPPEDDPFAVPPIGRARPAPPDWDATWQARLIAWMGAENLEMRVAADGWIDPAVLEHLRQTWTSSPT